MSQSAATRDENAKAMVVDREQRHDLEQGQKASTTR
jgi:hypothetical protein